MPEKTEPTARPAPSGPGGAKAAGKSEPAASRAEVPALNPDDIDIDSAEAQEQHQRRLAFLKRGQDLTQELGDTEVEIRRLENVQIELRRNLDQLEGHRDPLDAQRRRFQKEVDDVTKEIGDLRATLERLTAARANLEESVGLRKKERSEHVAAIAQLRGEKEGLVA